MTPDDDTRDREQRVADLLLAAARNERAPASLHAEVAALRDASGTSRRARSRTPRWRPAFGFPRIALPLAAALAAVLVLTLGGGTGAPSIAQAAALGARPPTGPAPVVDRSDPTQRLAAKVGSLHFPNWSTLAGWSAVGQRSDHVGNRTAITVYYAAGGRRVAYSIVSLPTLSGLHTHGEPYATIRQHGRATIVWEEDGHTCLLTGTGISPARLWQLATYGFRVPLG